MPRWRRGGGNTRIDKTNIVPSIPASELGGRCRYGEICWSGAARAGGGFAGVLSGHCPGCGRCRSTAGRVSGSGSGPSAFVRCDGKPNKPSTLGTVARLVAITAVVGLLLPQREGPDPKKRQSGADGIKSCDEALDGKTPASDGGRRIELILARALHRMETADWDGAIADLHSLPTDQPALTATRAYRQSLGLTAMYFEALALVGKGNFPAAEKLGLQMAERAPYDENTMRRAAVFVPLLDGYGPDKARFLDQLVRMSPADLTFRAAERATAGQFAQSGDDYLAYSILLRTIPKDAGYIMEQRAAIAYRLAGKTAQADTLLVEARAEADADALAGRHANFAQNFAEGTDFYAILVALDSGQALHARNLFAARSQWSSIAAGLVAEASRRLENVGTPTEQSASPIQSRRAILAETTKRQITAINYTGPDGNWRWGSFLPAFNDSDFDSFTNNVWRGDKSRYIADKPNDDWNAQWISVVRNGSGIPGAYALLLHLAVAAKAQGKSGFMLVPPQRATFQLFFRIGNPGDKDIVAPVLFNADTVITDLGPYFPRPNPAR
jgi:hypothetical protein